MINNILKSLNSFDIIILLLFIYLFFITFKKKSRENFVVSLREDDKRAIYELNEKFKDIATKINANQPVFNKLSVQTNFISKTDFINFIKNYANKDFSKIESDIDRRLVEKKIVLKTDLGNYKDDTVMKSVQRKPVHRADVGTHNTYVRKKKKARTYPTVSGSVSGG